MNEMNGFICKGGPLENKAYMMNLWWEMILEGNPLRMGVGYSQTTWENEK